MAERLSWSELGQQIFQELRSYVGRQRAPDIARMDALQTMIEQTASLDVMRGEVDAMLSKAVGPKGERGEDGKSVTAEDIDPLIEARLSKFLLDWERHASVVLQGVIDRMPRPKDGVDGLNGRDGVNGSDGRDGGTIEDFDVMLQGRRLMVGMKIGDVPVTRELRLALPMYQGVWRAGKYEKGDMVTYAGSMFIATEDCGPNDKPEKSSKWSLCVKRGRDGKDAAEGQE